MGAHRNNQDEVKEFGILTLVRGKDAEGKPQWAYIIIAPDKYLLFKTAEASGSYNLSDFGRILHYGAGEEPPTAIKEKMEEKYDANENFEGEVEKALVTFMENQSAENND